METLELPSLADMHVHLRQGEFMKSTVPGVRLGGTNVAYVMPNTVPPINSVDACLKYKQEIESLDPKTAYLMSLYLCPEITPEVIYAAAKAGIRGVKSYPKGATTNSDVGVESYEPFYPTFQAMQETGMVLNIHGEVPPSQEGGSVMTAEKQFLPTFRKLHEQFPKLKIILEHCSTKEAIDTVLACGNSVAGTITPHHLLITHSDWEHDPFSFCKPVAKTEEDRQALLKAATSGNSKFFLGSDSAPHPKEKKLANPPAAGIFTQPYLASYLAFIFDQQNALDKLEGFACRFGREFYGISSSDLPKELILKKESNVLPEMFEGCLVPFLHGVDLHWTCRRL
ncbi:dihydroorotase Ura2 [Schizosaccharomyces japonicus yFS275]|uniref:dihydroorotase n=1 Tax=Schizosaccharomyces japonicus (strain yFS275 / FY16936) TaxID=402676 RepID=B6JVM9_SCHJY|nr:dihydroorotase Ura2 [Schizosaccharomyces japonicus yFS275]EEB05430.1 dihydroorotase Ura2 [Schizosaccharomyces japonicus yFS275]